MKRNIWLALLCLSGGLSQNVMGSDKEFYDDFEKIETKVNMSADVLDASDLEYVKKIIQKYSQKYSKNSEAVELLMDRYNTIERKIKEKGNQASQLADARSVKNSVAQQQKEVLVAPQVAGYWQYPDGQNAQGENSPAQTGSLSYDDQVALATLISKPIAEMTREDFNTLDRLGTQKMSADEKVYWDNFLSTKKAPLADRRSVVEKEGAVIAKEQVPQPAEKPVEQVTKEQITKDQRECAALTQTWIRIPGRMKTEEKLRFIELLKKKHIAENYSEETLQRYKTEISKSLNDGSVPDADRIQSNQLAQKNAPESAQKNAQENAPEGPQNNVNRQQPQQNLGDEQEEDVLGTFAAFVKDTEEGKGSKSKKERQIKKQLSEASAEVIDDDTVDIDKKVSKLNGLFDLFPIKNKKKQTSVILNQIKIAARKSNTGGDKFFKRGQAFDLFWKFCATTPAKERTNAFFNAACVRDEDEFIEFMTTRLSTDKSSQAQLKTLGEFLINIKNTLNEDLEKKLMDVVFENVLKIEEASEDVSAYINQKVQKDDQKEYKDVLKMLTNGKAFFEKEIKDIEKEFKQWEDEDDLDSLVNKADDVVSVLSHFGEHKLISQKDKETLTKRSERLTKKISEEQRKVSE